MLQQQCAAAIQAAMGEYARQGNDLQCAVGQLQWVALCLGMQVRYCWRLIHLDAPELAMSRAVELARLAIGGQLFRRAFDAATFFTDQVQRLACQARGQRLQQVVGQLA